MTRPHPDLRGATARRRSALRATEVRMFPRSGPRTDGRCAEGPRVEWFDEEARPTDDPARGAERPGLIIPQQLFQNRLLCLPCPRVEWFDGEARPTSDPAPSAERPGLISPQQLFKNRLLRVLQVKSHLQPKSRPARAAACFRLRSE